MQEREGRPDDLHDGHRTQARREIEAEGALSRLRWRQLKMIRKRKPVVALR
jgi:hypothetical protein